MACESKENVILRLKKIEGQVRGLQKMIEEGRDCTEVIRQLSASCKALDKVGFIIITQILKGCMKTDSETDNTVDEAMKLFLSLS